jgi:agmatine/peptidylarginine deiminase
VTFAPFAPGEYELVEGILLAFDGSSSGSSTYDLDVVAGIAAGVTRPGGAKVFMVANNQQKPVAESAFEAAGVDMTKVEWINENINSVWIRDYGPRFICDPAADLKAAVDTKYYSNRVLDDALPVELGNADREPRFGHNNYNLNSVLHSGGNVSLLVVHVYVPSYLM